MEVIQGVVFLGDEDGHVAEVSESKRLKVETQPAAAPADTIQVIKAYSGSVGGSATVSDVYVIPNKTILTLLSWDGGGVGGSTDRSRVTLYYSTDGVIDSADIILGRHYFNIGAISKSLSQKFIGDGVAAIISERQRMNATAYELYAQWTGYLEYKAHTVLEEGITPTATATSMSKDVTKTWTANQWQNKWVIINSGLPVLITSNTVSALAFTGNASVGSNLPYKIVEFI